MILTGENQHPGGDLIAPQRGEVTLRLFQRAPQVPFGMNDQCRGRNLPDPRHRRLLLNPIRIDTNIAVREEPSDIAGTDERSRIQVTSLNDGSGEPVVMRGDPRCQVTPVRTSHHSHSVLVQTLEMHTCPVKEGQHIGHVNHTHVFLDRPAMGLPVGCGAPRVALHHGISRT